MAPGIERPDIGLERNKPNLASLKGRIHNKNMVFIYTTFPSVSEAKRMGRMIIERHLAACVNIDPIESIYEWNGEIVEDEEAVMIIKTNEAKIQDIEDIILQDHRDSVPFVGAFDIRRINRDYKEWMSQIIR